MPEITSPLFALLILEALVTHATSPLIDIGVNLTASRLAPQAEMVIERAASAGVHGLILTGTSPSTSAASATYAQELSRPLGGDRRSCQLWSTAGVHPHDAEAAVKGAEVWSEEIALLLTHPRVIAVGECGLDFERNYSPPEVQREVFETQLKLAVEHQLPLFLHQRGAHNDFYDLLKTYAPELPKRGAALAAVVHCFTDGRDELARYLELGCFVGITGWVCDERRGEALRDAVKTLPLDRVLVETDAPYLTPRTLRPRPKKGVNEPAFLPHIVEELARHMEVTTEKLAHHATRNTCELFALSLVVDL